MVLDSSLIAIKLQFDAFKTTVKLQSLECSFSVVYQTAVALM